MPTPKRTAATKKPTPRPRVKVPPPLSPGDTVEHGMTVSLKVNGSEVWIRATATSSVREEESGTQAMNRVANFIEGVLHEQATALING